MLFVLRLMLFFVCVFSASDVHARRPACGDVDRKVVQGTYERADELRFYYDVRDDLNEACRVMEVFQTWRKNQPDDVLKSKKFKQSKKSAIHGVETSIYSMKAPLTIMSAWLRADVDGSVEKAKRYARIRSARRDLETYQGRLKRAVAQVSGLMKD